MTIASPSWCAHTRCKTCNILQAYVPVTCTPTLLVLLEELGSDDGVRSLARLPGTVHRAIGQSRQRSTQDTRLWRYSGAMLWRLLSNRWIAPHGKARKK